MNHLIFLNFQKVENKFNVNFKKTLTLSEFGLKNNEFFWWRTIDFSDIKGDKGGGEFH